MNVWLYDVIIVTVLILFFGLRNKFQVKKVEAKKEEQEVFKDVDV